jgi:hypothetical protein
MALSCSTIYAEVLAKARVVIAKAARVVRARAVVVVAP